MNKKSWKDITITEYNKILEINERELDSPIEKDMAICALLNGIPEAEMYDKPVYEVQKMLADINFLKDKFSFNRKWNLKKMVINGKKCRVYQSISELTMAQYLDFETYWKDRDTHQGNVLACFIVPEGYQYNEGYSAIEFAQELEDTLSICDWNSIAFFFCRQFYLLTRVSLKYGLWETQKAIWREKNKTRKNELRELRTALIKQIRSLG